MPAIIQGMALFVLIILFLFLVLFSAQAMPAGGGGTPLRRMGPIVSIGILRRPPLTKRGFYGSRVLGVFLYVYTYGTLVNVNRVSGE